MQETGRAGRDGLPSTAILYVADLKSHPTDDNMKEYYKNKRECSLVPRLSARTQTTRNFEAESLGDLDT